MSPDRDQTDTDPAAVRWLRADEVRVDLSRPPAAPPPGQRLLVMVGLTGSGKTATVGALARSGAVHAVLPDRRALTDHVILPAMTGDPAHRVTDRIERFRLTAAFRERHPGGMGEVLTHLSVDTGAGWMVFDGVRGAAEVSAAVDLPDAFFAALEAAPEVRIARISLRGDPFDQAALDEEAPPPAAVGAPGIVEVLEAQGALDLLDRDRMARLAGILSDAGADPVAVGTATSIVVEESRHYDPAAALAVLRARAAARTIVVDTARDGVDDVVRRIAERLPPPG